MAEHATEARQADGDEAPAGAASEGEPWRRELREAVEVRRSRAFAALVGAAAAAMSITFLARASSSGWVADWVACGLLAVLAVWHLAALVDARTPLLVVDEMGLRLRFGAEWRGLPWEAVRRISVSPRRGLLRDGRVVVEPLVLGRVVEGLDSSGRRSVLVNQRLYHAPLAVPLGLTTSVAGARDGVVEALRGLAEDRTEVREVVPEPRVRRRRSTTGPDAPEPTALDAGSADDGAPVSTDADDSAWHRPAEHGADGPPATDTDQHRTPAWSAWLERRRADRADRAVAAEARESEAWHTTTEGDQTHQTHESHESHEADRADGADPADEPTAEHAPFEDTSPWGSWFDDLEHETRDPQSWDRHVRDGDTGAGEAQDRNDIAGTDPSTEAGHGDDHQADHGQEDGVEPAPRRGGWRAVLDWFTGPARDHADVPPPDQTSDQTSDQANGDHGPADAAEPDRADPADPAPARTDLRNPGTPLGGVGTIVSAHGKTREDGGPTPDVERPAATAPPSPLRDVSPGRRAEVTAHVAGAGAAAALTEEDGVRLRGLPEEQMLRSGDFATEVTAQRAGADERVRPISRAGDVVEPLVIGDFETRPAYDPVIGPEIAAARTRLGLSVDELAERTRIRPHVIESIEVDDFAPCGGDFYARGHLRTLARVLGKDVAPMLAAYEERYATAPVDPRRVFEAELATGMTGSMRSTRGGPNWGLLIAVVLAIAAVWGAARLFTEPPVELQQPAPLLNTDAGAEPRPDRQAGAQAGGPGAADPAPTPAPLSLELSADAVDTRVRVRDADGALVYGGLLPAGGSQQVSGTPPLTVHTTDGSLGVRVGARAKTWSVGVAGSPATKAFGG